MYRMLDVSLVLENFDLQKIANTVLIKSLDFLEKIFGDTSRASPSHAADAVLESSIQHFIPREMTPEMSNYLSRVALRALVGLPPIEIHIRDRDALRKLKGSIAWISKEKIDVTESIRRMRES